jgi:hypothetical protein
MYTFLLEVMGQSGNPSELAVHREQLSVLQNVCTIIIMMKNAGIEQMGPVL